MSFPAFCDYEWAMDRYEPHSTKKNPGSHKDAIKIEKQEGIMLKICLINQEWCWAKTGGWKWMLK